LDAAELQRRRRAKGDEMRGRVEGKVALVTGAARGIGRACAVRLAEEGADVALLDIGRAVETVPYAPSTPDQLEEAAEAVRLLGGRALTVTADARDGAAMREAVDSAIRQLGGLHILVAAAGVDSWGNAWELSDEQWDTMIGVNLTGVWQSAKAATPAMIQAGGGAMVFIGSVLSYRANKQFAHYTAAKHGVLGLARAFALELAPHRVRVNTVDPTAVATSMIDSQAYKDRLVGHPNATDEEVRALYLSWNVLPIPWIETVDVANAVLFLCSDEARFITGIGLPVDAGAMLK
jgi:SDR family mycofactocin-dependent oxidoreductase